MDLAKYLYLLLLLLMVVSSSCFKREHKNPIDPETPGEEIDINFSALSFDKRVELQWSMPDLQNLSAFRLYRRTDENAGFILLNELPPSQLAYSDTTVSYNSKYSYHITLLGGTSESNPSKTVTITPGPGYNWILDRWDYQLLKTTYDVEHIIKRYNLDWPPSDFAIAPDTGIAVIVYVLGSLVEKIDTKNNVRIEAIYELKRPHAVVYDSTGRCFWIVDSTGSLVKTGLDASSFQRIDSTLQKPVWLSVTEGAGVVNVVDAGSKTIVRYNREGDIIEKITHINGERLSGPEKYLVDELRERIWLVDGNNQKEYLYSKNYNDILFTKIDSLQNIGALCLSPVDGSIYIVDLNEQNSQIMQLSPYGNRQLVVTNLNFPLSVEVNHYDESILIADTYNSQVKHYDNEKKNIGTIKTLNYPLKVIVE
jgi:hypothetical protein